MRVGGEKIITKMVNEGGRGGMRWKGSSKMRHMRRGDVTGRKCRGGRGMRRCWENEGYEKFVTMRDLVSMF